MNSIPNSDGYSLNGVLHGRICLSLFASLRLLVRQNRRRDQIEQVNAGRSRAFFHHVPFAFVRYEGYLYFIYLGYGLWEVPQQRYYRYISNSCASVSQERACSYRFTHATVGVFALSPSREAPRLSASRIIVPCVNCAKSLSSFASFAIENL